MVLPAIALKTLPAGWYEVWLTNVQLITEDIGFSVLVSFQIQSGRFSGITYSQLFPIFEDIQDEDPWDAVNILFTEIAIATDLRGVLKDTEQLMFQHIRMKLGTYTKNRVKHNYIVTFASIKQTA